MCNSSDVELTITECLAMSESREGADSTDIASMLLKKTMMQTVKGPAGS